MFVSLQCQRVRTPRRKKTSITAERQSKNKTMRTMKVNDVVEMGGKSYTVKSVTPSYINVRESDEDTGKDVDKSYITGVSIELDGGGLEEWLRGVDAEAFAKDLRYYTIDEARAIVDKQVDEDWAFPEADVTIEIALKVDGENKEFITGNFKYDADEYYGSFDIHYSINRFDEVIEVDEGEDLLEEVEDIEAIAYNEKLDWLDSYKHERLKGQELDMLFH